VRLARSTSTFYEGDHGKGKLEALKRKGRTDWDVLKENHRFLRPDAPDTEDGDANLSGYSYEDLLSLKYYNQLYKEFAVIDLKHYKTGQLALRWRIEDELLEGIGQFSEPDSFDHPLSSLTEPFSLQPVRTYAANIIE
jgi:protein FRA10AC1